MNTKTKIIKNDNINIIGIFCIVDDVLKNLGLKDDVRAEDSNSEILTIAILAFGDCSFIVNLLFFRTKNEGIQPYHRQYIKRFARIESC